MTPDIVRVLRSEEPDPLMRSWPTVAHEAADEITHLRGAVLKAVEVIQTWHNMGGNESVWDIYWRSAPEMKPIREALAKVSA